MISVSIDPKPFLREAGFKGHFVGVHKQFRDAAYREWFDLSKWILLKLRAYIKDSVPKGEVYYIAGKGKHRASAPGQPPAILWARIFRGFETEVIWRKRMTELLLLVRNTAEHADLMEYGNPGKILPRPFFAPVIYGSELQDEIRKRMYNVF